MDDFDWIGLDARRVEPAVRGTIVMISMETSKQPLDLNHTQRLADRLQDGLKRLREIRSEN